MIEVRCSKLPLVMSCANAATNPDELLEVDTEFEAAETGTLIHRLAEAYISEGSEDIDHYADRLRMLDGYDRAHELFPNIQRVWGLASQVFKKPALERYLTADLGDLVKITGHIDVCEQFDNVAYVLDWKTGRVRDDHYHQMAGYAFLVMHDALYKQGSKRKLGSEYTVHCTVCYADDGSLYKYSFTQTQLYEWAKDVVAQLQRKGYTYNKRCVYCPLATACPAYKAKVTTALATITSNEVVDQLRDMGDAERADVLQKLKVVETAVKGVRIALKDDVRANGPMPTGDGREYVIKTASTRNLNAGKALSVLRGHLTDDEVFGCMTLSVAKAEAAAKKRADKGLKAAAAAELVDDLRKAGALFTTQSERLECQKIAKKIEKAT